MIVLKVLLTFLVTLAGWMANVPRHEDVQAATKAAAAVEADTHLKAPSAKWSHGAGFQRLASTTLNFTLRGLIASISRIFHQLVQKRRIYQHKVECVIEHFASAIRGSVSPLKERLSSRSQSAPDSHGVHDWHEAAAKGFLTPLEVVECQTDPDIRLHLQTLLEHRWTALKDGLELLETLPEDECVLFGATPFRGCVPKSFFRDGLQHFKVRLLSIVGGIASL